MTSALTLFRFPFQAMGSPCELQLFMANGDSAKKIADLAIADIARLEQRYSRYREDSIVSEINRCAEACGEITVDDETAALLNYADTCYQQSDGLFDITSGILRKAWNFKSQKLPEQALLDSLLENIGWENVRWHASRLEFTQKTEIDFGGIVKEYAADRIANLCRQAGAQYGVINLGGDLGIIGSHPDGQPWRIGIQDPRKKSAMSESINIYSGGVASSGDYERCITIDGIRYGHVLNPKTGWPVQHLAAVTVAADLCVIAGSTATIAMLKEKDGPSWLDSMGLSYSWIDTQGNSYSTFSNKTFVN